MAGDVPVISARFADRTALRDALVDTGGEMSISLPGDFALTAGTPVAVRLAIEGLDPGMFLEGVVQLRRPASQDRGAAALPGLVVQILRPDRVRFQFLREWVAGTRTPNGRRAWRFPFDSRIHLQALGVARTTSRLMHTSTIDVSANGAQVMTPRALTLGEAVVILTNAGGSMRDFAGEVVWTSESRAGVRLRLDGLDVQNDWSAIVLRAENSVQSREMRSLRSSFSRLQIQRP